MKPLKKTISVRTGVAAAATAGLVAIGGLSAGTALTTNVFAEAVTVEAPQAPSFAAVVEGVSPAVVSVRVKSQMQPVANRSGPSEDDLENMPEQFQEFFRRFGPDFDFRNEGRGGPEGNRGDRENRRFGDRGRGGPRRFSPVSQGSGFFISEDGYLVTNNHVVEDGRELTVIMDDGTELDAELVGTDPRTDLALLKVDEERKFTYVDFADDSQIRVGDWVVAIGNPFGLGGTVTAGIVSGRGRDIGAGPYDDFIQVDAAVNRGNSGGPTFNLQGQVIGVNTAIFSPSGGNVGIAFAIPASTVTSIINDLREDGRVERGWLGVQIQPVSRDIADSLGLEETAGALVVEPQEGTPAAEAGIESGDVVLSVDGKAVKNPRDLSRRIASLEPGTTAEIALWRDGEEMSVELELGALPDSERQMASAGGQEDDTALGSLGLTVTPADDGNGAVITDVADDSEAAEKGLSAGDVILEVNEKAVKSIGDIETEVQAALENGRRAVLFRIKSEERTRFVALPVSKG